MVVPLSSKQEAQVRFLLPTYIKKIETILKSSDIKDLKFSGYSFDSSENLILLETQTEKIYRYSKTSTQKGLRYIKVR